MIYADNAATTPMSEAAINTMTTLIRETYGNPSSLYEFGQKAKEVLEQAREDTEQVRTPCCSSHTEKTGE